MTPAPAMADASSTRGPSLTGEPSQRDAVDPEHASAPAPLRLLSPRPRFTSRFKRMSKTPRVFLTSLSFAMFFAVTSTLGMLVLPLLFLLPRSRFDPARFTRALHVNMRMFSGFMRDAGLIDFWPPTLPEEIRGRPYLLIANHPSLIDVVLLVSAFPEVSCVAKAGWYAKWIMGPMLRRLTYVPGPGYPGDDDATDDVHPVVRRLEETLRGGTPVLVFPEGTRSHKNRLQRFGRGAIEAAIRAEVPIVPLFIALDTPMLMKGQPFYHVPDQAGGFSFECFDVVETAGRDLDGKVVTRQLEEQYRARFARLLEERETVRR